MISPVKKEYITQEFGANPDLYSKFGLKGHNGIDYRAFNPDGTRCYIGGKSEVFAPHDGKVLENALDINGYGNYIKIQNDKEGTVLGHFFEPSPMTLGAAVKEGDLVGHQGSTGNSTGIHLHWGYYTLPRDRTNGYNGYINQAGLYGPNTGENMADALQVCLTDREKFWKERDELLAALGADTIESGKSAIAGLKSRITDLTNQLGTAQAEVKNMEELLSRSQAEVLIKEDEIKSLESRLDTCQNTVVQLGKDKGNLAIEVEQLKIQIETLKQQATNGEVTLTFWELIQALLKQSITIKKG